MLSSPRSSSSCGSITKDLSLISRKDTQRYSSADLNLEPSWHLNLFIRFNRNHGSTQPSGLTEPEQLRMFGEIKKKAGSLFFCESLVISSTLWASKTKQRRKVHQNRSNKSKTSYKFHCFIFKLWNTAFTLKMLTERQPSAFNSPLLIFKKITTKTPHWKVGGVR